MSMDLVGNDDNLFDEDNVNPAPGEDIGTPEMDHILHDYNEGDPDIPTEFLDELNQSVNNILENNEEDEEDQIHVEEQQESLSSSSPISTVHSVHIFENESKGIPRLH